MRARVPAGRCAHFSLDYEPGGATSPEVYAELRAFAARIAVDNACLAPRDMIDLQSFMWVMGSDEYP